MEIGIQIHVPATIPSVKFETCVCYASNFAVREVVAAARRSELCEEALTFWRVTTHVVFTDIMRTINIGI